MSPLASMLLSSTPLCVLSPHSDDAALSVGLLLAARPRKLTKVVTVFNRSDFAHFEDGDLSAVTALRVEEDRRFFAEVGAAAVWFDYMDARLRLGVGRELGSLFMRAPERELVKAVANAVAKVITPDTIVLAPWAVGEHVDHRAVRQAAESLGVRDRLMFYADQPYWALTGQPRLPGTAVWAADSGDVSAAAKRRHCSIYASQPAAARMAAWTCVAANGPGALELVTTLGRNEHP